MSGDGIIRLALGSTVVVAVAAAAAVAVEALAVPYAVLAVAAFLAGIALFAWTFVVAAGRSRHEALSVAGIWFLAGSAPVAVRRRLLAALVIQSVVVVGAAAARPYTAVAFGVLAPLLPLALAGLWGARYGTFPDREPERGRRPGP